MCAATRVVHLGHLASQPLARARPPRFDPHGGEAVVGADDAVATEAERHALEARKSVDGMNCVDARTFRSFPRSSRSTSMA